MYLSAMPLSHPKVRMPKAFFKAQTPSTIAQNVLQDIENDYKPSK